METVLSIRHLQKSFGRRKIINDVSFDVYAGEVFGFLGPNGAGKTTTIKMITGFLRPDGGTIGVCGFDLRRSFEKAMENVGAIVENPEMYRDLSGLVNLRMYARVHRGVDERRIRETVELVGMQNRIREKVKKYSLGMKQRAGLAQALLHRPRLLILDEPTNGLDPAGIRDLRDILKRLAREEHTAVFVSSHLLSEMQLMCDRVAIIDRGRVLGVKPIAELLAEASPQAATFRFSAKPLDLAAQSIAPAGWAAKVTAADTAKQTLDISCSPEDVPDIVALLVTSGVRVYGVERQRPSLEEAFIFMTGGGNGIA